MRIAATFVLASLAFFVAACGSSGWNYQPGETHVVRAGETLAGIADRYGKDYRDLARWNRLGDGSLIYPGQVIRLTAAIRRRQRQPVDRVVDAKVHSAAAVRSVTCVGMAHKWSNCRKFRR